MQIDNYAKVDFHVHSSSSKTKEGDVEKTINSTFEFIDVLFERMNNSKINMFSITDHNTFDYELYKNVKSKIDAVDFEYQHIHSIIPGIEFDLDFDSKARTHAICLFNDTEPEKLALIEGIVSKSIGIRDYNKVKLNETQLNEIIREIGLDFILIVHQKTDIMNTEVNSKTDFTKIDNDVQDRLLYCDYFTLYESNQHLFRFRFEDFKKQNGLLANFITGSDCHDWSKY